jgi:fructoselysine 6-kinase
MKHRLLCLGDNVVDVYVDEQAMFPGGNAVNVAVHASRLLGYPASYIGVVGTDEPGQLVLQSLHHEGVDVDLTRVVEGPNAYATVRLSNGDRQFGEADPGVSRFVPSAADFAAVAAADMVHTGECSMLEDSLPELRDHAERLSFDFSERDWDYVAAYAPFVDVAILSRPHGSADSPIDVAERALTYGPSQVVVSSGVGGAVWTDGSRVVKAGVELAVEVIDTLGAGDALIARVLVGLLGGEQPEVLLSQATAYATRACLERGGFGHRSPLHPASSTLYTEGSPQL